MNPYKVLKLDRDQCLKNECWICGSSTSLELHHVIMRAHGGDNWPTVNLCADHHSLIHKLALSVEKRLNTDQTTFSTAFNTVYINYGIEKKLLTPIKKLVTILVTAKDLCSGDNNKSIAFSDRFPPDVAKKLKSLAVLHNSSQQSIVRAAIKLMYGKYFT